MVGERCKAGLIRLLEAVMRIMGLGGRYGKEERKSYSGVRIWEVGGGAIRTGRNQHWFSAGG